MIHIEGFLSSRDWNLKDKPLKDLGVLMDAKVSTGSGNSSKGLHRHPVGEHEIFVVISGTAKMIVDKQEIKLGRGAGEVDLLVTGSEEHGMYEKSEDFQCVIIFLKPGIT